MKIDVTAEGNIRLQEVFNSVVFETEGGQKLTVCMRDDGFEIAVNDPSGTMKGAPEHFTWYRAVDGNIKRSAGMMGVQAASS